MFLKDLGFHISTFSEFLILSFSSSVDSILKGHVVKEIMCCRQRTKIKFGLYVLYTLIVISIILKSANLYCLIFSFWVLISLMSFLLRFFYIELKLSKHLFRKRKLSWRVRIFIEIYMISCITVYESINTYDSYF